MFAQKNRPRSVSVFAIMMLLSIGLLSCGSDQRTGDNYNNSTENITDSGPYDEDSEEYCTIRVQLLGAEDVSDVQSTVFGYRKEDSTFGDGITRFGVGIVSEDDNQRVIYLVPGNYYAYTNEIGEFNFAVDDVKNTYFLTVDYTNKKFSIENEKSR